jgi:hypothetical protein
MSEEGTGSILHAVVYYPHLDSRALTKFRRKYDPFAELIAEHLTLVFPVPVGLETIRPHVQRIAAKVHPFDIHIAGVRRTWDHWMYLGLSKGYEEIVTLHDQLYSGPLREYLRTDLEFEPHVGLGFFGNGAYDPLDPEQVEFDSEAYEHARREVAEIGINAERRVERLTIVRLNTGLDTLEDVDAVRLGS